MEAAQAISLVTDWIRSRGLDYPTEGLAADRFDKGWSVYAPVEVDDSDPMAFLDIPVGRSIFLVGDSGRIEEVSSSIPPQQAREAFTAREGSPNGAASPKGAAAPNGAAQQGGAASDEAAFMAEFERQFRLAAADDPSAIADFTIVDEPPAPVGDAPSGADAATAEEASRLIDSIVQQLAQLGPEGWDEFSAVFAFTVTSQIAQLQFWAQDRTGLVPVPQSIADLVRQQREVSARMSAGPWWRLLLNVNNRGETTVDYDYGDEPFPDDQIVAAEHYRNDLDAYPRAQVPVWLAGYTAGPDAQGRDAARAAADAAADQAAGRTPSPPTGSHRFPTCWRAGRCSRRRTPAPDRAGVLAFTPATPGSRATPAAGRRCSCCRAIARCSPAGNGIRSCCRPPTTVAGRCPISTGERPRGSTTRC